MNSSHNLRRLDRPKPRWALATITLVVPFIACALASHPAVAASEQEVLAPTGHLRVGIYPGSPTSLVTDPGSRQNHGVTYDLGKEFATRLNVPVEYVTFQRIADVIDAIKDGKVDFTVTNATEARAREVSFSQTLLAVELGYLIPAHSKITQPDQMEAQGVRIGVTKGGTSERVLSEKFRNAKILAAESVSGAINALRNGDFDVYATNKAILFQMAQSLPGSRVLDGNWGQERMAIATPKGREAGKELLNRFVQDVQSSGLLKKVEATAGLKGAVSPPND